MNARRVEELSSMLPSVEHDGADAAAWVDRLAALASQRPDLDAFEVRADSHENRRYLIRNGTPLTVRYGRVHGIGVRAFSGRGSGYAYTNELSDEALRTVLDRAARLALANANSAWATFEPRVDNDRRATYQPRVTNHPHEAELDDVLGLLRRAEAPIRESAPAATTQVAFGSRKGTTVLANSAGGWVETESLLSTLLAQSVLQDAGRVGSGNAWRGGERGLGDFEDHGGPEEMGAEVGRQAIEGLDAVALTPGRYRTLCDNELTGVLAHESFGHLTEYDLVACGWSVLNGRQGERLARPEVTIRDVPVMEDHPREGVAVPLDQEGTPGRPVTLLDRGVLNEYMHTRESAGDREVEPTGSARALNIQHQPIVRMRNTYVEPGDLELDEAMELVGDGVYLIGGAGGAPRCDGSFTFTSTRGYEVKGGERGRPIKLATIHGNVLDFLQNVEGATRDFDLNTTFFGGCGKWDQPMLHVGYGGPHLVVSDALVGGQGA